mmetsp:Transcript_21154/g.35334  ORF Transcript_21154/g.35334 Transcript_21154/m.35334 type:complete len:142 (+) Transcript_21154:67-492(+)
MQLAFAVSFPAPYLQCSGRTRGSVLSCSSERPQYRFRRTELTKPLHSSGPSFFSSQRFLFTEPPPSFSSLPHFRMRMSSDANEERPTSPVPELKQSGDLFVNVFGFLAFSFSIVLFVIALVAAASRSFIPDLSGPAPIDLP